MGIAGIRRRGKKLNSTSAIRTCSKIAPIAFAMIGDSKPEIVIQGRLVVMGSDLLQQQTEKTP